MTETLVIAVVAFWREIHAQMPEWRKSGAHDENLPGLPRRRTDFIHSHGVVLHALGRVGKRSCYDHSSGLGKSTFKGLRKVDWRRSSSKLGKAARPLAARRSQVVSARRTLHRPTCSRQHLGVTLAPEEQRHEDAFRMARDSERGKA